MASSVDEKDKDLCFDMINIKHYHRNIASYCILGLSNIGLLAFSMYKITSPPVLITSVILNGIAHFLKSNSKTDRHIEELKNYKTTLSRIGSSIEKISVASDIPENQISPRNIELKNI